MKKPEVLESDRINDSELWNGKTGDQVEYYIKDRLEKSSDDIEALSNKDVANIRYEDEELYLVNKKGETICHGTVSVVTPQYEIKALITGIYLDGELVSNNIVSYKKGSKYELGVIANYIMTQGDKTRYTTMSLPYVLTIGSDNRGTVDAYDETSKITPNDKEDNNPKFIDITNYISNIYSSKSLIKLRLYKDSESTTVTYSDVVFLNPSLTYTGGYTTTTNSITFNIVGASAATINDFVVEGYNGTTPIDKSNINKLTINNLHNGVNNLTVRGSLNSGIKTDWINVQVIYYQTGDQTTYVAINGISKEIGNNAVAVLFKYTIYSPSKEKVTISSYIKEQNFSDYSSVERDEYVDINRENYNEYNIAEGEFRKYIELQSSGTMYLGESHSIDDKTGYLEAIEIDEEGSAFAYGTVGIEVEAPDYTILPVTGATLNFSQSTGRNNNVFTDLIEDIELGNDYTVRNGKTVFTITPNEKSIFKKGYIDSGISGDFTFEIGLETYNISNEDSIVLKMGSMQIKATEFAWNTDYKTPLLAYEKAMKEGGYGVNVSDSELPKEIQDLKKQYLNTKKSYLERNAGFNTNEDTHIIITLKRNFTIKKGDLYYPDYLLSFQDAFDKYSSTFNLLSVYINGIVKRLIILSDAELTTISNNIDIHPTGCDIAISCLKVYNECLSELNIRQEYVAFLSTKSDKLRFIERNDILNADTGEISWNKARLQYNCIVSIYPKNDKFTVLNRGYGAANNEDNDGEAELKKYYTSLMVTYANQDVNKKYGGLITKLQRKGQGSSAKRYFIWNELNAMNKFTTDGTDVFYSAKKKNGAYECKILNTGAKKTLTDKPGKDKSQWFTFENEAFDPETNKFKFANAKGIEDGILLPTNSTTAGGDTIKVTKLVGKVNFASSMQSHKLGACELYNATNPTKIDGRKAVKELPFLYFYYITDLNVNEISPADLISDDANVKFIGFLTWGSGKCDKATWDVDYGDVLVIEGAENTDNGCNFQIPWQAFLRKNDDGKLDNFPTISGALSLLDPLLNVDFRTESIFYTNDKLRASWDVDTNVLDSEDGIEDSAIDTMKFWREFCDFVYQYDFSYKVADSFSNLANWDTNYKYCVTLGTNNNHTQYDVYRYDLFGTDGNGGWVPAGLYYNNGKWDSFNLKTFLNASGSYPETWRATMKAKFVLKVTNYIDIEDVAHHLAVIKYLSGTDNRAKNTYFKVRCYKDDKTQETIKKILMYLDDLDTVFITDNLGLQSKAYNLLEPSYNESTRSSWGDSGKNIFFRNFDRAFESKIKELLTNVVSKAPAILDESFYGTLKYFPEVSWNHTARIYYELGEIVFRSEVIKGADGTLYYTNNDENPITQSHGNYLEGELYYMLKRLDFLKSYAVKADDDANDMKLSDAAGGSSDTNSLIDFVPYQDFYPLAKFYDGTKYILSAPSTPTYDAIDYLAVTGTKYNDVIVKGNGLNAYLSQSRDYKELTVFGLNTPTLAGNYPHLTDFTIDNTNTRGYNKITVSTFDVKMPVLENLTLVDVSLPTFLDLEEMPKLKKINLSKCTGIQTITLPKTARLTSVVLPASITELSIINNPNLTDITLEGWNNINSIVIENAGVLENSTQFFSNLKNPIQSIVIGSNTNPVDIYVTEDIAINMLKTTKLTIHGTLNIIDDNGKPADITYNTAKLAYLRNFKNIQFKKTTISSLNIPLEILVSLKTDILDIIVGVVGNDIEDALSGSKFSFTKTSGGGQIVDDRFIQPTSDLSAGNFRLKFAGRPSSPQAIVVLFETFKPKVGCFAYGDGTFSDIYDSVNRDLMGLVYAIDDSTDNVYIIGKEYVKSLGQNTFYGGPDIGISKPSGQNDPDLLNMYNAVASMDSSTKNKILTITVDAKTKELGDLLTIYSWGRPTPVTWFEGKENTEEIVNAAAALITTINDSKLTNSNINLKYLPYYQATHLYEPEHNYELNELYKQGNWYVPNRWELKTVLEQRALSSLTSTNIFSIEDLEQSIKTSPTTSVGGVVPIFSLALKAKANFDAWNNLGKSQNAQLTSSLTESPMNSYYIKLDSYNPQGSKNYELTGGLYISTSSWTTLNDGWCGHAHTSVPFVIFNTQK